MRKGLLIILSFILIFAVSACKKMGFDNCFRNTGEIILQEREANEIHYVLLENNVNLVVKQDTAPSLRVEAGENIIDKVITEVNGSNLYIRNENNCNWMRSYENEITVYLGIGKLDSLDYRGSGDVSSQNTIRNDSINISVWEGSGTIEMSLDVDKSSLNLHYGTVDMHFKGKSNVTYIYASSYGPVYCENLDSKFTYVNNRGTNDCYVRASVALEVTIEYLGNIYYYGTPAIVKENVTAEGELIKLVN